MSMVNCAYTVRDLVSTVCICPLLCTVYIAASVKGLKQAVRTVQVQWIHKITKTTLNRAQYDIEIRMTSKRQDEERNY